MEQGKINNEILPVDMCERKRVRTNSEVVCELAIERNQTADRLKKLYKAIEANPEAVSARQKDLWHMQAKAMQDYVDVLGLRIKDLIDSDTVHFAEN